jgi:hypothetical protein
MAGQVLRRRGGAYRDDPRAQAGVRGRNLLAQRIGQRRTRDMLAHALNCPRHPVRLRAQVLHQGGNPRTKAVRIQVSGERGGRQKEA